MKVILVDALDVFDDDNKGLRWGLSNEEAEYIEWFLTQEARLKYAKENDLQIDYTEQLVEALTNLLHNEADSQNDAVDLIEEITGKRHEIGY
jgi:hypothetical protein